MESIASTACIDTCDDIMGKVGKPKGLIRYVTEDELEGKKKKGINPRTVIYCVVIVILLAISFFVIGSKQTKLMIMRGGGNPFRFSEGRVVNHFSLEFYYKENQERDVYLEFKEPGMSKDISLVIPMRRIHLKKGRNIRANLFVKFSRDILEDGQRKIIIKVLDRNDSTFYLEKELPLVGPY